uniref:PSP1 C-terminal conserved region n=1 Tax=uncultured prokaryote TaxID=198431 RepID=H5SEK1_9ZZZZ|nr:PSP1 C-terminal conserved region [uncultured prokaryote]
MRLYKVRFKRAGKLYDVDPGELDLKLGERVIVEGERGVGVATVVMGPYEVENPPEGVKPVIRKALPEEIECSIERRQKELEAFRFCLQRIEERGLPMKLIKVEELIDGSKIIFYFTAEGRIDFRELVKDLAARYRTRIEMRQIGVRDEVKMLGAIGPCGRETCCSTFLYDFEPISVRIAKEQNIILNPSRLSGICGRLMCCLIYEYEAASNNEQPCRSFPQCDKFCPYVKGEVEFDVDEEIIRRAEEIEFDTD